MKQLDGCTCTVLRCAVLLKVKLVFYFRFYKEYESAGEGKYLVAEIVKIDRCLIKILQK